MEKAPLDKLQNALLFFQPKLTITNEILASIASELVNMPAVMDGIEGNIDYYSPHASVQMAHHQHILEKYLREIHLLQAVLSIINKKTLEIAAVNHSKDLPEEEKVAKINGIKKTIDTLRYAKSEKLIKRKDIQIEIEVIKKISECRNTLKNKTHELNMDNTAEEDKKMSPKVKQQLENEINSLKLQINNYEEGVKPIPEYASIERRKKDLQARLSKHLLLKEKIPEGMLDVKRALSLNQKNRIIQKTLLVHREALALLNLPKDREEASKLSTKIKGLEMQEKSLAPVTFSSSVEENNQIDRMLEDLRQLMATSVKGYQELAISGGEINAFYHKTTGFYWENLSLYRETLCGIDANLQRLQIQGNLTPEGQKVATCIHNALKVAPPKKDIQEALMQIKSIDKNLNQRKKNYDKSVNGNPIRFYKGSAADFVDKLLQDETPVKDDLQQHGKPFFYIPYNANSYALDHPSHIDLVGALGNCYGETQMFLKRINGKNPSINNICPETELINFQLDQERKVKGTVKKLGEYTNELDYNVSGPKEFVKWSSIKHLLIGETDSKNNGDLCYLRLEGARAPGHDKDIAHAIGFIKMKHPSPYKYIVYDYNLGAMGFSDDAQLEAFFKKIFEGEGSYYPYAKCVVEKVAEVSDECQQFFKGVKPLEIIPVEKTCNREYWDKSRLDLLVKYSPDLELIVDLIKSNESKLNESDHNDLYKLLIARSDFNYETVLKVSVEKRQWSLLEFILQKKEVPSNLNCTLNIKDAETDIATRVKSGIINPHVAAQIFSSNRIIVNEAYKKDPMTIKYASMNIIKELLENKNSNTVEVLKMLDQSVVETLVKDGHATYQQASSAFLDNANFKVGAGYETILRQLQLVNTNQSLAQYDEEKKNWMESLKKMPDFFSKNRIKEVNAGIKAICQLLMTEIRQFDKTAKFKNISKNDNPTSLIKIMNELSTRNEELNNNNSAVSPVDTISMAALEQKSISSSSAQTTVPVFEQSDFVPMSESASPNEADKPVTNPTATELIDASSDALIDNSSTTTPIFVQSDSISELESVFSVSNEADKPVINPKASKLFDNASTDANELLKELGNLAKTDLLLQDFLKQKKDQIHQGIHLEDLTDMNRELKILLGVSKTVNTLVDTLSADSAWYKTDGKQKGIKINTAFAGIPVEDRIKLIEFQQPNNKNSNEFSSCNSLLEKISEQRAKWGIFKTKESKSFKTFKEGMSALRAERNERLLQPNNANHTVISKK